MTGGVRCAVADCYNTNRVNYINPERPVYFHRFPKNRNTCDKWIEMCNRQETFNVQNARVCSEHFIEDDYERDLRNELLGLPIRLKLKPTAVPSRNLFDSPPNIATKQSRKRRLPVEQIFIEVAPDDNIENSEADETPSKRKDGEEESVMSYPELLEKYKQAVRENEELKRQLRMFFASVGSCFEKCEGSKRIN